MRLSQFLTNQSLPCDPEITHLTQDSRSAQEGSLFFCVCGGQLGERYAREALARGAAAVAAPETWGIPRVFYEPNPRLRYSLACKSFWGDPARDMILIGVTGTNGKTTTAWLLHHILETCGRKTGLIGTVCSKFGQTELPARYTTPDAGRLYPLLRRMRDADCQYVVLEASSQALAQERLAGLDFRLGIFTNLTPDHLDYHHTMGAYFEAKKRLFSASSQWLVNGDCPWGRRLMEEGKGRCRSWSFFDPAADYQVKQCVSSIRGSQFQLIAGSQHIQVELTMPGEFSAANCGAALAASHLLGIPLEEGAAAVKTCTGVPGRTQLVDAGQNFGVMIDYAHTSDGMEKVLTLARSLHPRRLIVVFGCAGERDREDRRPMAQVACSMADSVIFTEDNPRRELWEQICGDISQENKRILIQNREEAIRTALSQCEKGDLLLLLGKGHEKYQVLADRTVYFDEEALVKQVLKKG